MMGLGAPLAPENKREVPEAEAEKRTCECQWRQQRQQTAHVSLGLLHVSRFLSSYTHRWVDLFFVHPEAEKSRAEQHIFVVYKR